MEIANTKGVEISKSLTLAEAVEASMKETTADCSELNWEILDGVVGQLLDTDNTNDDIGKEEDLIKIINSLGPDQKKKMVTGLTEKYGIKFVLEKDGELKSIEGDDEENPDEMLDMDEIGQNIDKNSNYKSLVDLLAKINTPSYTFEDFKVALPELAEGISENVVLSHFASKALGLSGFKMDGADDFKRKIDTLLKNPEMEEVFNALQQKAQEKATTAIEAADKLSGLTEEQRTALNPMVSLDVGALFDGVETEEQVPAFKNKLASSYFGEINKIYSELIAKAHPQKEKKDSKKENTVEKVINLTAEQVTAQMNKIDAELPLVVRSILTEDQIMALKEAIRTNEPFPIELSNVQASVDKKLEGLTIDQLKKALTDLDLESIDSLKFIKAKIEPIGYGYKDTKWVGKYETYLTETGPTGLDFSDWIAQQEVPPMERFMAMIMNLIGPFLDQINSLMGKGEEDKDETDNSKRGQILKALNLKIEGQEETVESAKDTKLEINKLINDHRWTGVNIAGFCGVDKSGKDIPDNRSEHLLNNTNDIELMESVLAADSTTSLGMARTKGFEMKTLKAIKDAEVDELDLSNLSLEGTDEKVRAAIALLRSAKDAKEVVSEKEAAFTESLLEDKSPVASILKDKISPEVHFTKDIQEKFFILNNKGEVTAVTQTFKSLLKLDKNFWDRTLENTDISSFAENIGQDGDKGFNDHETTFHKEGSEFEVDGTGTFGDEKFKNISEFFEWLKNK